MRLFSQETWALVACVGVVHAASGIMEVDLVFPRNETYAPSPLFPIVFAFQNPELAPFLIPQLSLTVWDWNNMSESTVSTIYDLRAGNFSSSDPYFHYQGFTSFSREGTWKLTWNLGRDSCTEESLAQFIGNRIVSNNTGSGIIFTTKSSAQQVDLVAATVDKVCSEDEGVAINVTDTLKVPASVSWDGGEICAVVATTAPTADPCQVTIGSAAASSMSSSMTARACQFTDAPVSCPAEEENAARPKQLAVGWGVVHVTVAIGALGYILV
jgi:hypothetical protein